ncbi:lysophospholipid acyltransferase family protein [Limnohabitans sp.]|uniref:lysophospholipid acyltransferase family protein n=1 Tax=Limnohabitans sp. TaxID=1907725 RepID=UPI00286F0248|nr:lysophospholipid acyltransferase family protein [Limnohabitans sp.]
MRSLNAIAKFVRVIAWVLRGYWHVRLGFSKLSDDQQARAVEVWARGMLAIIGIEVRVKGHPALGPVLMAANHISWLDILVMHAACHCRFVAKSEIRSWPLVGVLTTGGGSLYIERGSRNDAMRVVHQMAEALQQGHVLAVFPEGATGDGITVLPFHANLLQAAVAAHAPIQPVALQFIDAHTHDVSLAPCYRDDDTLASSLWRTLCAPPLLAQVRYGDKQYADGRSRREWAQDLHATVAHLL